MCVCVTQSCPTLCDSMDCSPPGFSVRGISQARMLEWVTISFSRESSRCRDRTQVFELQAHSLPWATREALSYGTFTFIPTNSVKVAELMKDVRSASYHITQSNYLSAEQSLPMCPNWGIQVPFLEHKHNQNLILTERSLSTTEKNSGLSTNRGRFERGRDSAKFIWACQEDRQAWG